jgi:hypothetical protein
MRHLLGLMSGQRFGQVLITDTDAQRLHTALDGSDLDVRFFHIGANSTITREETIQRTIAH